MFIQVILKIVMYFLSVGSNLPIGYNGSTFVDCTLSIMFFSLCFNLCPFKVLLYMYLRSIRSSLYAGYGASTFVD